ncbi:calphotin-like [Nymphalis io]|uniref:calphotin-like n=1 Tax=Inachis io TaxID=171585 RepID=UPI0021698EFA|nr:calphotin-like [Nymphalis io]
MKFFAIFAAVVAVALARPGTSSWTLQELSDALQNPNVNPAVVPILEHALNEIMTALYNGEQVESVFVPLPADVAVIPSPVAPAPVVPSPAASSPLVQIIVNVKSQQQVAEVPVDPTPVLVEESAEEPIADPVEVVPEPIIVNPIDIIAVNPVDTWGPVGPSPVIDSGDVGPIKMKFFAIFTAIVAVAVARPGTSTWTLQELSNALQNPNVNPAIVPILEHALNEIMTALYNGEQLESVFVPLPADVDVIPSPVVPAPVIPSPAGSSPLVQIIVNVKSQQQVAEVPVEPTPVLVEESAEEAIADPVEVIPDPVLVEESAEEAIEEPVVVVPEPIIVNPIDVIAVNPVDVSAPPARPTRPGTSAWTLQELSDALQNPNVNPAIVPVLEHALNELMTALHSGHEFESIHVPLPADIPILVDPVIPSPVEIPAVSSPLVQLIINVKSPQQVADVGTAPPAIIPGPEVNPVDVIAVNPIEV